MQENEKDKKNSGPSSLRKVFWGSKLKTRESNTNDQPINTDFSTDGENTYRLVQAYPINLDFDKIKAQCNLTDSTAQPPLTEIADLNCNSYLYASSNSSTQMNNSQLTCFKSQVNSICPLSIWEVALYALIGTSLASIVGGISAYSLKIYCHSKNDPARQPLLNNEEDNNPLTLNGNEQDDKKRPRN